jgi:hypothetical protein
MIYVASLRLPEPVFTARNPVGNEPIYTLEGAPSDLHYALKIASNPVAAQIRIFDLSYLCSINATGMVP